MYERCLVAVAHPDDETLGCGGFLKKLSKTGVETMVLTMTDGVSSRMGANETQREQRKKNFHTALNLLGVTRQQQFGFPDNQLDSVPLLEISKTIETTVVDFRPNIIITHSDADLNQDHRVVSEATKIASRPQPGGGVKLFLAAEVLSSSHWSWNKNSYFAPNYFVDIAEVLDVKIEACKAYDAEMRPWPHARSIQAIEHLCKSRGALIGMSAAEAFEVIYQIN